MNFKQLQGKVGFTLACLLFISIGFAAYGQSVLPAPAGGESTIRPLAATVPTRVFQLIGPHGASSDSAAVTNEDGKAIKFTRTYKADDGYVIAAIILQQKQYSGDFVFWETISKNVLGDIRFPKTYELSFDADGGMDTRVVVLFAKEKAWWVAAGGIGSPMATDIVDYSDATAGGPCNSDVSETGVYYVTPTDNKGGAATIVKTAGFFDENQIEMFTIEPEQFSCNRFRGAAVSEALGVAIFSTDAADATAIAVDLSKLDQPPQEGVNCFRIQNDLNLSLGALKFSEDGLSLYGESHEVSGVFPTPDAADQTPSSMPATWICKWSIKNGLKTNGVNLEYNHHWFAGPFETKIQQIDCARFSDESHPDGADLLFVTQHNTERMLGVNLVDTSVTHEMSAMQPLLVTKMEEKFGGIAISGVKDGTPHLTVVNNGKEGCPIEVYALDIHGNSIGSEPIISFDRSVTRRWNLFHPWHRGGDYPTAVSIPDDESVAYFGGFPSQSHGCTYVVQARIEVKQSIGKHGASSEKKDATLIKSGNPFTCTYTADDGYVIAALYMDDVAVPEAQFKTSYKLTIAPESDTAIKVLFAKDDAWWVDAQNCGAPVVASLIEYSKDGSGGPFSSGLSENGAYYATPTYMTAESAYLFKTADLLMGDTTENLVIPPNKVTGASNRGADVSEALGMAIFGTADASGAALAVDVTATTETLAENENYFRIENDQGIPFGCMEFTADGQYLYTDCYKGRGDSGQQLICKWKIENGLRSSGVNLTHVGHWDIGVRVCQIAYANINGKDLIYVISNGGLIGVLDTTTERFTTLRPANESGDYGSIAVSGVASGTPHLTVVPSDNTFPIAVYALTADGLGFEHTDPIAAFDPEQTKNWDPQKVSWHRTGGNRCTGANVADDESVAYIGAFPESIGACTYVVKASRSASTVAQVIGAHGVSSDSAEATIAPYQPFVRTYTADEDFVIGALYVNGVPVADAQFKSSYDLKIFPDGDTAVNVFFAKKGTWWVNEEKLGGPIAKGVIEYSQDHSGGPFSSGLSEDGAYYATPTYMTDESAYLFKTADLLAGDTTENLVIPPNKVTGVSNRGADVSEALGMAIFGSAEGGAALAVDVNATTETLAENENYFRIENDQGISFGCMEFTADGQYLYTDCYKGGEGNHWIYKFAVANGLRSSGVNLTLVAKWDVSYRVCQLSYARINGKDLIYYISNGGLIGVLDTTDGTPRVLRPANESGDYGAIAVSGASLGTPNLTVVPCLNSLPIVVYGLAEDGLSFISSEPMIAFDSTVTDDWNPNGTAWQRDGTGWGTGANITDDGTVAYFGAFPENLGSCTYVVTARPTVVNVIEKLYTAGVADPEVRTNAVHAKADFIGHYEAPAWYRIDSILRDGREVFLGGSDYPSISITIPRVTKDTILEVFYVIPADGTDGYSNEQASWFAENGITKENVKSDTDDDGLTAEDECLLGLSATEKDTFEFQVSSIDAKEQVAVAVKLVRTTGGETVTPPVRGTLVLEGTPSIDQPFQEVGTLSLEGAFDGKETETFTFDPANAKFFRAVIQ